jgi:hypothetical protein
MATDEPNAEVTTEDTPQSVAATARPQLRLHHLFALTAIAAVMLALNGPQTDYWGETDFKPSPPILTLITAYGVLYVLLISVALTAIAYGIAWQRQGIVFFDQPGHWLMVEIGITGLFALVPSMIYRWMFSTMDPSSLNFPMTNAILIGFYSLATLVVVPLALNLYIGIKKCRERRWKVVFFMKSFANLLLGIGAIVIPITVLIAANIDRRERTLRDVGHWCGVWLQLTLNLLQVGVAVVSVMNVLDIMSRA